MLSLVLPTYNEAANITSLIDVLDAVLADLPHEIIVVDDDSPDGTWRVAEHLTRKHPSLRVLRRVGRRGLSSAVTEGFDMARGDILAVMDADGQHDASLLLKLVSALSQGSSLAIGSRYVEGGSVGDWLTDRRIISNTGTTLAHFVSRVKVSDPLGGFFALKTSVYRSVRPMLRPTGFKILLEILANLPAGTRVSEVPLIFRMRLHGQSKLSLRVHIDFAYQVTRLMLKRMYAGTCALCGIVFALSIVIGFLTLTPGAWHLRQFVFSPASRQEIAKALMATLEKKGWLLSDIHILRIDTDSVSLLHREHRRGGAPSVGCTLELRPPSLLCAE